MKKEFSNRRQYDKFINDLITEHKKVSEKDNFMIFNEHDECQDSKVKRNWKMIADMIIGE